MESVVLLGLMGVGYLMNKDKNDKNKIYSEIQPPIFTGSGNSVYDQANYLDAKKYEIKVIRNIIQEIPVANGYIMTVVYMIKETILILSIITLLLFNNFVITISILVFFIP